MFTIHAEVFINTFPEIADEYRAILKKYKKNYCGGKRKRQKALRKLLSPFLKKSFDSTLLKEVLSDKEFKAVIKNKPVKEEHSEICPECVTKHLSNAWVLLNEIIARHEENIPYLNAQLTQAIREGWEHNGSRVTQKHCDSLSYSTLRNQLVEDLNIDVSKIKLIGHLNIIEELIEDINDKNVIRYIRRKHQGVID